MPLLFLHNGVMKNCLLLPTVTKIQKLQQSRHSAVKVLYLGAQIVFSCGMKEIKTKKGNNTAIADFCKSAKSN